MSSFATRLRAIRQSAVGMLKKWWARVSILSLVTGALIWALDRGYGDGLWEFLKAAVNRPVGVALLTFIIAFFAWFAFWAAFVLLRAFYETRPPKKKAPERLPAPPPLPAEDLFAIDQARKFWRKKESGIVAVNRIIHLSNMLSQGLAGQVRLTVLLVYPRLELERARDKLDEALRDYSTAPLNSVLDTLGWVYRAYMEHVRWIDHCKQNYGIPPHEWCVSGYEGWQSVHIGFMKDLSDLSLGQGFSSLESTLSTDNSRERFLPIESPLS